jgi:putative membrane-bound dehydrogenase-like protein
MKATFRIRLLLLLGLVTLSSIATADDDFPKVYNSEPDAKLLPLPADESAAKMKVPEGFSVSVFAAEPDVQNPIAMSWDTRGRLWIAENYTYAERTQRFDLSLRDRVLVFEDKDLDGKPESRKVFLDQVQMLTSVEVGRGGVWLMCPPQVLFVPDANEDAVPDGPPQVVLDGFTVAQDNYHNFANGLKFGPDGWLYGRCGHSCPGRVGVPSTPDAERIPLDGGIWRYHPERKTFEALCHGTTNPWGHDWDENGELFFINTVIGHLWHMMPGAHMKESFGESMNPRVYERMDMIADHYHFDTKGNWMESRDGKANDFGGGHAHIGAIIYNGGTWPKSYNGKIFTFNMHGLRANVERLERQGAGYVGLHEPDFLVATDKFFRGIDMNIGPDGNMYCIDWSDTGECHEHTGVHRTSGRIFKVSHPPIGKPTTLAKPSCMVGTGKLPKIWAAYQAGKMGEKDLIDLLSDPDEHVRVWAIRLLSDHWPLDTIVGTRSTNRYPDISGILPQFEKMAMSDPSGLVKLALASTLQRMPVAKRVPLATALAGNPKYAADRDLPYLVWYGLIPVANESPKSLIPIATSSQWPSLVKWISRSIATDYETQPAMLEELLTSARSFEAKQKEQLLLGMSAAFRGKRKLKEPASWSSFIATNGKASEASDKSKELIRDLSILFGNGLALDEIRRLALDSKAEMKMRQQALATLIEARPDDLRSVCESLVDTKPLNSIALNGLSLYDDPEIGRILAKKLKRFTPEDRPSVIEVLVSRTGFADAMLDVMQQKDSPIRNVDINAFHARQIRALGDEKLNQRLEAVWGRLHDSPREKIEAVKAMKQQLTHTSLSEANLGAGRALFNQTCSQCHKLYGIGAKIGPDITGAQRSSLDYLLENIMDPSAVVGKDYRMTIVRTEDGRTLSGLVVSNDGKKLEIQTQSKLEVVPMDEVEQLRETTLSPMPDGLLSNLTSDQIRDLIGYLMHPSQVPLP